MLKNLHSEYSRWDPDEVKVFFENKGVDLTNLLPNGMSASVVVCLCSIFILVRCILSSYLCWGAHAPYTLSPPSTSMRSTSPWPTIAVYYVLFSQFEVEPLTVSISHVATRGLVFTSPLAIVLIMVTLHNCTCLKFH